MMSSRWYVRALLAQAVVVAGLIGCGEVPAAPTDSSDGAGAGPPLVLSDATTSVGPVSGAAVRTDVAYASLVPGTVPGGVTATIRNLATGGMRTTPMVDGGFDPVAIPASTGDEIELVIHGSDGGTTSVRAKVPARRPPVVVRTSPPRGKTDVPLNAVIIVVFSEPMDPDVAAGGRILLRTGGVTVEATPALASDGLRAELTPLTFLAGNSEYEVVVAAAARDLSGEVLGSSYAAAFTTGSAVVASLDILPASDTLLAGTVVELRAVVRDPDGNQLSGVPVEWTTETAEAASMLIMPGFVQLIPHSSGAIVVRASAGGVTGSTALYFEPLTFTAVAPGGDHTCATTAAATVHCWGANNRGQAGASARRTPAPHLTGAPYHSPASGPEHSCALADGIPACWGHQPGSGPTQFSADQWPFATDRFATLAAGGVAHECALGSAGRAYCWGYVQETPGTGVSGGGPLPVEGGEVYVSVAAGNNFFCLVSRDGASACGGLNDVGQAGHGDFDYHPYWYETEQEIGEHDAVVRVQPVLTEQRFVHIAAGTAHVCALTGAGEAWCWGDNQHGQFGVVDPAACVALRSAAGCPQSAVPVAGGGGLAFEQLAAGDGYTCGLTAGGRAYCWGRNQSGQLGLGHTSSASGPTVPVGGDLAFTMIAAGRAHACGLAAHDGKLYCWGGNRFGQLGDGTTADRTAPVLVAAQAP